MNGDHGDASLKNVPPRKINHEEFERLRKFLKNCKNTDDIELSLEVEIDESIKDKDRIFTTDEFDVTIIDKEEKGGTISLNVDEVGEFLGMIEDVDQNKDFQVYATAFDSLRRKLPCLDPREEEKPGAPCMCKHCGMVGVLVESSKRPAIPHAPNPNLIRQKGSIRNERRRIIDLRSKSKSETNLILLRELSNKIIMLEDRLMEQEENMVRKDYFKYVIHKLITQYTNKINELKEVINKYESVNAYYPVVTEENDRLPRSHGKDKPSSSKKSQDKDPRVQVDENFDKSWRKIVGPDLENKSCNAKKLHDQVSNYYDSKKTKLRNIAAYQATIMEKSQHSTPKDKMDVSYINPAATRWFDESSDQESTAQKYLIEGKNEKHTIEEKLRYLKQLAKQRNVDESCMWKNILMQAKKHIKSNDDTISIQLPSDDQKLSELELTISSIKEIVRKSRCAGVKSSHFVGYKNVDKKGIDLHKNND